MRFKLLVQNNTLVEEYHMNVYIEKTQDKNKSW
jgi:hypothetical protein